MKVIYIASPYTLGDVGANVALQLDAAHRLMDMDLCPIAPLLSHYLHIHRQRPYQDWIDMDRELVRRSDAVLRLGGESKGADGEVELARHLGIPVFFGWDEFDRWISTEK